MRRLHILIWVAAMSWASNGLCAENSAIDRAKDKACKLGDVSDVIVSAIQSGSDANKLIRENSQAWRRSYNKSANAAWAKTLRKFAEGEFKKAPQAKSYEENVCTRLKPLYAIAFSAQRVSEAGGKIVPGAFLVRGRRGLQIPKPIEVIGDRCNFLPIDQPRPNACSQ